MKFTTNQPKEHVGYNSVATPPHPRLMPIAT